MASADKKASQVLKANADMHGMGSKRFREKIFRLCLSTSESFLRLLCRHHHHQSNAHVHLHNCHLRRLVLYLMKDLKVKHCSYHGIVRLMSS
ncbi:hypothetical protein ACJIZ3_017074 [Penstemon smallii]|uniref:Uncharacterized protein n=1 Tax=Penstemon smallii TaxID=265156 RepID=A0ABD3SUJ0_9LAMI